MGEKSDSAAESGHVTTKEEENGPSNVTDGLKPNDSAISVDISGAEEEDNCGNCREQDKEDEQLPPEFIPEDPDKEELDEEQQAGDLSDAASFLEDDLQCTPLDEIMEDPVEITPNPPQKKKLKRKKAHSKECPRNPSRELFGSADSKVSKKPSQKRKLKEREKFQDRDITEDGVWVQCENMQCKKWRFLKSETDPAKIPEQWTCIMHPDENFNSCDKLEEDYSQLEFIHNKFTEGSIVWAKMQGFPWWPAMVETDPDRGEFMLHNGIDSDVTHYHCVFLDEVVSRSWVRAASVKKFEEPGKPPGSLFYKKKDYSKSILPAKKQALDALKVSIKERIDTFGFSKTFKGVWTKQSRDCSLQELDDSEVSEDILCSILSSEDMKELEHETDGWISEAVEAMRETTTEDMNQLLVADDHKEKKHGRKRKAGNVDDRGTRKRKKHNKQKKNHKSKKKMSHDADRKKKGKKKRLEETAMTNSGEEDGEVLHGEENEIKEMCEAIEDEDTSTEIASTVAEDTNTVAVTHQNEGGQEEDDVTVECEKETSNIDPIVLDENESNEMKIHTSSNRNDDTGVQEQGEGTSKTEKIQRQREKKEKALEEKARKQKEREMKKEKKEQEMKEKEEKRKARELKKQQVKERKEKKKKKKTEKDEKAKKQIAQPISKSQHHDQKVIGQNPNLQKKAKFSAPKGKPKAAFLAPVQAATCNEDMELKSQKDNNRSASPNDIEMHDEDRKESDQGIKHEDMTTTSKDGHKDTTKYAVDANEESVDTSGLLKTKRKKFSVKRKLLGETKVETKLRKPVTVETDQSPATEEVRDRCTEVSGRGDSKISERRVVDEEKYDADDVDVLDIEWTDTVFPSLGVKAVISATGDDDSDPFEAVEE
ncbi:hypothetical protein BSL78_24786 [Apostichopus japonicus]|uniref:Zinc finger CW-type PWWP domain protein 1-like n=1 Tax=Stichopus japonicus TaxID=307972 RepID=A0A2G8JRL7_STIJA|nr:hypothetical protein BSL78_24786 [Apostichopus japonicus]